MSTPDITDCPLGRALRAVRKGSLELRLDWSDAPLERFTEALRAADRKGTGERTARAVPRVVGRPAKERILGTPRHVLERVARMQIHIRAALDEGRTLKEAAEWLNERGIKSARGGRWHNVTVARYAARLNIVGPTRRVSQRRRAALERLEPQFRRAFAVRRTLRSVAAWLDEHGIKPPRGRRWNPGCVLTLARRFGLRGAQP